MIIEIDRGEKTYLKRKGYKHLYPVVIDDFGDIEVLK